MEAAAARVAREGELLAGKYQLDKLLGAGGMGEVYRAQNVLIGRTVAIKLLRAEHAGNPDLVERFMREARAANIVRHPHVVDVLDIDKDAQGTPFIVQEFLEGEDLCRYVERHGGRLPLERALAILMPVIDAVAFAHGRGVVHRDLKPENVFLATTGRALVPKLLDFGISQIRAPGNIRMTADGTAMGTPAYMSPEQIRGSQDVDARTDVWALGVMLYEVLSGILPFFATTPGELFATILTSDASPLTHVVPDAPPELAVIVGRCLRRHAQERYPSAAELARDLRHLQDGFGIEATQKRSLPPGLHMTLASANHDGDRRAQPDDATMAPMRAPPLNIPDLDFARAEAPLSSSGVVSAPRAPAGAPAPVSAQRPSAQAKAAAPPPISADFDPFDDDEAAADLVVDARPQVAPAPVRRADLRGPRPPIGPKKIDTAPIVAFGVLGVMAIAMGWTWMQFIHPSEAWPVLAWTAPLFAFAEPVAPGATALAGLVFGALFVRSTFVDYPRSYFKLVPALGFFLVALGIIGQFADKPFVTLTQMSLVGGAVVPFGLCFLFARSAWDYWVAGSRALSIGTAALGSGALFVAGEWMRGIFGG